MAKPPLRMKGQEVIEERLKKLTAETHSLLEETARLCEEADQRRRERRLTRTAEASGRTD